MGIGEGAGDLRCADCVVAANNAAVSNTATEKRNRVRVVTGGSTIDLSSPEKSASILPRSRSLKKPSFGACSSDAEVEEHSRIRGMHDHSHDHAHDHGHGRSHAGHAHPMPGSSVMAGAVAASL